MERHASFAVPRVCIDIPDQLQLPATPFEPQKAMMTPRVRSGADDPDVVPPEHQLTVLAMQLAVLEKAVSRLGTLAFIWATVVLLGGFAITLSCTDFWCITLLLLTEGARIQGRSHEVVWQQRATCLLTISLAVGHVLFQLQLLSASVCATVSLVRLVTQRYGVDAANPWTNRRAALDIFYGLALVESLLFLVEKALWQWRVGHHRLLERVAKECHLAGTERGILAIRRFFYDSYSRGLKGSIFDGLHMNLVSYADDMLTAGSHDEQSLGASILAALAESDRFADSTLRKIGMMSASTIERLIHMLSWKNTSEIGVRRSAAVVVSMLTGRKIIAVRLTGIPEATECVASLLYADLEELNLLGLTILSKLANDHDNCDKIGKTRSLLDKIISYCSIAGGGQAAPTGMRLKAVKKALLVVKRLAGTTGATGKLLRRELSDIVFTVSNVREVLQQREGEIQSELHQLAIEILTSLAIDKEAREKIGGTGGVVRELVAIFLPGKDEVRGNGRQSNAIRNEAGKALAMLALESRGNCGAIIMACGGGVERLVEALSDPIIIIGAARILRNLCTYVGDECQHPLRGVAASATKVLSTIMVEKTKILNIFLGLAAQMLRFMEPGDLRASLATARVTETALARTLLQILREYSVPCMAVPRIRRYTIELVVAMMRLDTRYMALFVESGMEGDLKRIADTTPEIECFNAFSGSVGHSRRTVSVCSLIKSAMELMKQP
ncbi:uncharacterized protein LOC124656857 [Lolium rigidum]|uniref:uncharacterized protein LOC124656857 n=1 Tax=Lolium rigidum TaxID=89674 RepID=UPI001F5D8354|nr:uncharacterized protein LOC124656857 [Lolium rigidum]